MRQSIWDNQVHADNYGPNDTWPVDLDMTDSLISNAAFMPTPGDFTMPHPTQPGQNGF